MSTNNILKSQNKYLKNYVMNVAFFYADIQNKTKLIYFACRLHLTQYIRFLYARKT